jgi:hypothetical protein
MFFGGGRDKTSTLIDYDRACAAGANVNSEDVNKAPFEDLET